jgi:hypothetical protein
VQPFPPTGAKFQISKTSADGHHPVFSRDGRELFYVPGPGQFEAVAITTTPSFGFGNPVPLPRTFGSASPMTERTLDVTPDGRILGLTDAQATAAPGGEGRLAAPTRIQVVLNWFQEVRERAPLRRAAAIGRP